MSPTEPRAIPLVVSMTTLPSRIQSIRPALDSLCRQNTPPDRIMLCLPRKSRREGVGYEPPSWLQDYAPLLEVVRCEEDSGPGTKLLGGLDRITTPSCLVIADDDMRYREMFLQHLYEHQIRDLKACFTYYAYPAEPLTIGQGADGFSFYTPLLDGIVPYAERAMRSAHLRAIDDLWISGFLWSRGIPVKSLGHLLPSGETVYESVHYINQLHRIEGDLSRKNVLLHGVNHLKELGLLGRRHQVVSLIKKPLRAIRNRLMP